MNDAAYREVEDRNIVEAIRMQEETGLATISDGEFRRGSWAFGLVKAVEGFGEARSMFEFHDAAGNSYPFDTCYAVAKIRRSRPIAVGEFEFVRRHTERVPKVTMPAPSFMHFFRGKACADPAVYPDVAGFWADLLRVYHEELAELGRAGAQYLQIDEVPLAMLCDPAVRERARAIGEDPDALVTMYINAVNDVAKCAAARDDGRDASVPWQPALAMDGRGKLRGGGRAAVQRGQGRRVLSRIRHAARGRLRAAALHGEGQDRGARTRQHQDAGARRQPRRSAGVSTRPRAMCRWSGSR